MNVYCLHIFCCLLIFSTVTHCNDSLPKLSSYNVKLSESTVSGLSAGGYMAVQMHVAYSASIKASGIFAGGPYHCSEASLSVAVTRCMSGLPMPPNADALASVTRDYAKQGRIDQVDKLSKANVYLFSGTFDTTVYQRVMNTLNEYYRQFDANIVYENGMKAAHTMPTDNPNAPNKCSVSKSPFVSDCQYDAVGAMFKHMYGSSLKHDRVAWDHSLSGKLLAFDQNEFISSSSSSSIDMIDQTEGYTGLDEQGFVYVPASCAANKPCRLHLALHGCLQNYEAVGDDFMRMSGYMQWADTNAIIVLFPQTIGTGSLGVNPNSCFDWWGMLNNDQDKQHFDDQQGIQMSAIFNMMKRISSSK